MDLQLNITTGPVTLKIKKFANNESDFNNRRNRKKPGGFDFKFTTTDNIKAVVARKKNSNSNVSKTELNKVIKKSPGSIIKKSNNSNVVKQNYFVLQKKMVTMDNEKNIADKVAMVKVVQKPLTKSPVAHLKKDEQIKLNTYRAKQPVSVTQTLNTRLNVDDIKKNVDEAQSSLQETGKLNINLNVLKALDDMKLNAKYAKLAQKKLEQIQSKTITIQRQDINKSEGGSVQKNAYMSKMYDKKNKYEFKKPDIQKGKFSSLFSNNPDIPQIGQRLVKPATETLFTGALVSTLGLHAHSVKNLSDLLEITELTTVQQRTIPNILAGRDMLVRSQTGSGKTLAYSLPVIEKLQEIRPKLTRTDGIQALVIVPTRELAVQAYELYLKLLKPFTWIVPGFLCGGEKRKAEKARLRRGINILVGTPGRLCDHLVHTESFSLNTVKWLILDEADKLLEFGYEKDVRKIVDAIKENSGGSIKNVLNNSDNSVSDSGVDDQFNVQIAKNLQTILLSATLTKAVEKLAGMTLNNPLFIDTSDALSAKISSDGFHSAVQEAVLSEQLIIPSTVVQSYVLVPPKLRFVVLSGMIASECNKKASKILVFMATQDYVDYHHDVMVEILTKKILDPEDNIKIDSDDEDEDNLLGRYDQDDDVTGDALLKDVRFFKLHGLMTQQERSGVFKAFIEAKSGVLLTTDVAGRGIDVPKVDLVIQYSAPQKMSDYVHRVGRTARAGRKGRAVIFLAPNETQFVRMLEDKGIRIAQDDMKKHLDNLLTPISPHKNAEIAANDLQHNFEMLINEDKEIHDKACKAFISWIRYYSAFPKDFRTIFNVKDAHMGHYAKSVGLREPPKSFARKHSTPKPAKPQNRLTMSDRDDQPKHQQQQQSNTLYGGNKRSGSLSDLLSGSKNNNIINNNNNNRYDKININNNNIKNNNNNNNNNNFYYKMEKFAIKSVSLLTSEFDSGLAPNKKLKKK